MRVTSSHYLFLLQNSDSSKVETDGFPSFRLEEFIATSRNRKGSNAKVQSQCYWTNLGAIVKSTVNKIECSQDRALVIGCGTGRLAFEVSGFFDTVCFDRCESYDWKK